jgi:hypothetical protein
MCTLLQDILWSCIESYVAYSQLLRAFAQTTPFQNRGRRLCESQISLPNNQLFDVPSLQAFDGEIDEDSLQRFDHYAHMVKKFILRDGKTTPPSTTLTIPTSVYIRLAHIRPRPLPSLTHLHCASAEARKLMMFLISPRLKQVLLTDVCRASDVMMYLSVLKTEAPLLQHLDISSLGSCFLPKVLDFTNLRFLNIRRGLADLTGEDIGVISLGLLKRLDHLRLDMRGLVMEIPAISDVSDIPRSLTWLELDITHHNVAALPKLLELYEECPVRHLNITAELDSDAFKVILSAIPVSWSATLADMTITRREHREDEEDMDDRPSKPLSDFVQPLYRFRELKELTFWWKTLSVTDNDISNISNAWPNLTSLYLDVYPSNRPENADPLPTMASLRTLSQRCPQLNELHIPLDITSFPSDALEDNVSSGKKAQPVISNCQLKYLSFVCTAGDVAFTAVDPFSIAYHLDLTFPHLVSVSCMRKLKEELLWRTVVLRVLRICHDVRRRHGIEL